MATTADEPVPPDDGNGQEVGVDGSTDDADTTPDKSDGQETGDRPGRWGSALNWVTGHPAPVLLLLGGLAWLAGYLAVGVLAGDLGIQASVLGLDYRDHILLSLPYFLLLVALASAPLFGMWLTRGLPRNQGRWVTAGLVGLCVVLMVLTGAVTWLVGATLALGIWIQLGGVVILMWVGAYAGTRPGWFEWLEKKAAAAGSGEGDGDGDGGATANQDPLTKKLWQVCYGVVLVVLVAGAVAFVMLPVILDAEEYADNVAASGEALSPWTPLALVIRPKQVTVYGNLEKVQGSTLESGDEVTLLSDKNSKAVLIHDHQVRVENSTTLTFITTPGQ